MDPFLDDLNHRSVVLREHRDQLISELGLIEAEMERLSVAAEVYRSYKKAPLGSPAVRPPLHEAIGTFLKERGGFGRIPDIYSALLREGLLNAKNKRSAYNQVYGTLHRHSDRFRQVGGGLWALVDAKLPATLTSGASVVSGSAVVDGVTGIEIFDPVNFTQRRMSSALLASIAQGPTQPNPIVGEEEELDTR